MVGGEETEVRLRQYWLHEVTVAQDTAHSSWTEKCEQFVLEYREGKILLTAAALILHICLRARPEELNWLFQGDENESECVLGLSGTHCSPMADRMA